MRMITTLIIICKQILGPMTLRRRTCLDPLARSKTGLRAVMRGLEAGVKLLYSSRQEAFFCSVRPAFGRFCGGGEAGRAVLGGRVTSTRGGW